MKGVHQSLFIVLCLSAANWVSSFHLPPCRTRSIHFNGPRQGTQLGAVKLLGIFVKSAPQPPPPPPSAAAVLNAQIQQLAKQSTIVGNLKAIYKKLNMSPEKASIILKGITQAIHWEELLFFFFMGWFFVPAIAIPQNFVRNRFLPEARPFRRSYTKVAVDQLAQLSRIGFVVYIVDILKIILQAIGFNFPQLAKSPHIVAQSLLTWWLVSRVANLKRYILAIQTRNVADELTGSASLVDRLIDAFLYGLGLFVLLTTLETQMGAATMSFAAFGGLSTVIISLASQGLISQVFYGLFLASSWKFRKGDIVKFGDGKVIGCVVSLGWMDTLIRGPDGVIVSVPNRDLALLPVSNLSRVQISSVREELRFKYRDADKLPQVMNDIKEEIRLACPDIIVDGSRPFRAYWTGYGKLGLEATVEAHFRIRLISDGDPFWENRQNMLVAIHKAVKKNKLDFAVVDEKLVHALYDNFK